MGLLELDPSRGTARLQGVDDLGMTLFRLVVTARDLEPEYLSPALPRGKFLTREVASSLRRVYLLERRPGGRERGLPIGLTPLGPDARGRSLRLAVDDSCRLRSVEASGGGEDWLVRYDDYFEAEGTMFPRTIVLEDRVEGLRLTITQESVRRSDGRPMGPGGHPSPWVRLDGVAPRQENAGQGTATRT